MNGSLERPDRFEPRERLRTTGPAGAVAVLQHYPRESSDHRLIGTLVVLAIDTYASAWARLGVLSRQPSRMGPGCIFELISARTQGLNLLRIITCCSN